MAVVTFGKAVEVDMAALGELLARHFPTFKWQGAAPDGGAAMVVTGRSATDVLLVELRPHASAFAGAAPPHLCHVEIVSPPAGQPAVALRVELVAAGALMLLDEAERALPAGLAMRVRLVRGALGEAQRTGRGRPGSLGMAKCGNFSVPAAQI